MVDNSKLIAFRFPIMKALSLGQNKEDGTLIKRLTEDIDQINN
jgi:hypothetical protein